MNELGLSFVKQNSHGDRDTVLSWREPANSFSINNLNQKSYGY